MVKKMEAFPRCSLFKYRQCMEEVKKRRIKEGQDYDTIIQKSRPDPIY